ncbi:MAG: YceI family protein [Saprospiraceae bacterium]
MRIVILLLSFFLFRPFLANAQDEIFIGDQGKVSFVSNAPLEIIQAESNSLKGVISPSIKGFAFSVNMSSFQGFNSDIQRTHFLENYMEQKKYPQATFSGKIIEDIDFDTPGTYIVRAKGELEIHGIRKERIIKGTLIIKHGTAHIFASFSVPAADHGIAIPKIVKQKIAEEISVSIDIQFVQGSKS